jgi:hypothetical protein
VDLNAEAWHFRSFSGEAGEKWQAVKHDMMAFGLAVSLNQIFYIYIFLFFDDEMEWVGLVLVCILRFLIILNLVGGLEHE